jgi:tRNA(Arg) A34 adenosine deaminase TadA
MNAIDKIAYSQGGGVNSKTSLLQDPSIHDDVVILPQAKRSKLDSYLCTGYDLYIKMEPCIIHLFFHKAEMYRHFECP